MNPAPTLLVVDDETEITELLADYFNGQGYPTRQAGSAAEARACFAAQTPDLVILDVRMPGEDGLSLARWIRGDHPGIGIILLTTAAEVVDRIVGLEMGADDYVPKPFDPRELLARVRSVLRRREGAGAVSEGEGAGAGMLDWVAGRLTHRGQGGRALELLIQAGDWPRAGELLRRQAPELKAAGRERELQDYLERFPGDFRAGAPWLEYLLGQCRMGNDFARARESFTAAWAGFAREGDVAGLYLALAGAIDSVVHEWSGFAPLGIWLERLAWLRGRHPVFPDRGIEIRVAVSALTGLMYHTPGAPGLPDWADRLEQLLLGDPEPLTHLTAFAFLAHYHAYFGGDHCRARMLVDFLEQAVGRGGLPPLSRIVWQALLADHHWMRGEFAAGVAAADLGLKLARESGCRQWDTMLLLQKAWNALALGDQALTEDTATTLKGSLTPASGLYLLLYHQFAFMRATLGGDPQRMLEHARICLDLARHGGFPWAEGMAWIFRAKAHLQRREFDLAHAGLDEAAAGRFHAGRLPSLRLAWLEARAELALTSGETGTESHLAAYFGARKRLERCGTTTWDRPVLARLCVAALERHIDPDYVCSLVSRWGYRPDSPPRHLDAWPWPVRIQALGGFRVEIDGRELVLEGKAQNRPLDLLKALVAFGGVDVPQEKICDALWPDSDGDAAQRALDVNLHRLRKRLDNPEWLQRRDGRLSLDPRFCWIDLAALESVAPAGARDAEEAAHRALALARGPLLEHDAAPWVLAPRQRLARRHAALLRTLGDFCASAGRMIVAHQCRQRAEDLEAGSGGTA